MAYEFKKLSDVAAVETPADTANVLIEEDGVIKKVAKDAVVPSNVALKSDIPDAIVNPTVAEVGQTIVVKAVDENGKPTEWECSDIVASWDDLEDKPFYEELVQPEPIFDAEIELVDDERLYLESSFVLEEHKEYKVIFDDVEYIINCYFDDTDSSPVLDLADGDDWHLRIFSRYGECFIDAYGISGIHTIKIIDPEAQPYVSVKPLDEKYIPDTIARAAAIPKSYLITYDDGYHVNEELYNFLLEQTESPSAGYPDVTLKTDDGYVVKMCGFRNIKEFDGYSSCNGICVYFVVYNRSEPNYIDVVISPTSTDASNIENKDMA